MDELREFLTTETITPESPAWHVDALRETEQRYKAGREQSVDWDTAKRRLRKHGK